MPVQSVVVSPEPMAVVSVEGDSDTIVMSGWAWSGGGRGIVRVDLSVDNGVTWHTASSYFRFLFLWKVISFYVVVFGFIPNLNLIVRVGVVLDLDLS